MSEMSAETLTEGLRLWIDYSQDPENPASADAAWLDWSVDHLFDVFKAAILASRDLFPLVQKENTDGK